MARTTVKIPNENNVLSGPRPKHFKSPFVSNIIDDLHKYSKVNKRIKNKMLQTTREFIYNREIKKLFHLYL